MKNAHRISLNFLMENCVLHPGEIEHVIATIFQPGGWSEISAQAETYYIIRPLICRNAK